MGYKFIRVVLYIAYRLFFRFRSFGAENVPGAEDPRGVILAPNHSSFLDPPILGISLKRPVTYLAKEYLFRKFIVRQALEAAGAHPIHSEAQDFRSIRQVIRLLKEGRRCVAVFPEGTRSPDGSLREAEGGLGFLAIKSVCWVVPVYIRGTYEAFPRDAKMFRMKPISVHYGKAFIPAQDPEILAAPDPYLAVGQRTMREIQLVKAEADKKV